jgi:DNA-binding IclR family transcriptional regulator
VDAMSDPAMDLESIPAASLSAKSLTKGIALLDAVAAAAQPPRLVDLVRASGLARPTAVRLLSVLCKGDLLRLREDGTYALGPRLAAWGQAFLDGLDLTEVAHDLMQELVDLSGESCYVGVLDRNTVLYVAAVKSPRGIGPVARKGSRMPLHSTGIGQVLLAWSAPEAVEELLAGPLEQRTPRTLTDKDLLVQRLAEVRRRGYAIDDIENEDGIRCVAAPIFDHTGTATAGMSVSAAAYRFSLQDLEDLRPMVVRAAGQVSGRLGKRASE